MSSTTAPGDANQGPHEAPIPFFGFASPSQPQTLTRAAITAATRCPEPACVAALLDAARLPPADREAAQRLAADLATRLRQRGAAAGREGLLQAMLHEFSLSSQEGVALMCLAEALLRIPDAATRDALIRDKIGATDWASHLGHSRSLFVDAATWGLLLTGRLVSTHDEGGLASALTRAVAKSGEPLIRRAVDTAMRLLGEQFVAGETIREALDRARRREAEGFRHSFDMLGEAAMTDADAECYLQAYRHAIDAIGARSAGRGPIDGPGISIKLSALHPRYGRAQRERAMDELYPRLAGLAQRAREHDIGLNIDAEEADRLELSLDLLERLCEEPALADWDGIGFVVQAYQKRCPAVVEHLIALARRSRRRLMLRLVKGAYWDSEIKRAQVEGAEGYPVYTRRAHTDLCYLACARRMLAAPDAIYPQFATHNAHTLAAVHRAAGDWRAGQYEFQCLHGMGEPLYARVIAPASQGGLGRPCRIYAPVGTHRTLLAYLVRRLLENGANTSFVNRIGDERTPIDELVADPVAAVEKTAAEEGALGLPHPAIALPRALYAPDRVNSAGLDLANEHRLIALSQSLLASARYVWQAAPTVRQVDRGGATRHTIVDPADSRDVVGEVIEATVEDAADAVAASLGAAPAWQALSAADRAARLERGADLIEAQIDPLIGLLVREAGKTCVDAVGEVREAADFLRYYAALARSDFSNDTPPLGPVVCISPWNFPLAIFTGQVAAALAAGNTVLAKPARQTPLVAAQAVRLLHLAGVPAGALQLLPGPGQTIGAALVADPRIRGVVFTGSTSVAKDLQRSLAGRLDERGKPLVLIAETGGQNAMIVDSSALAEQVVADVIASAFDSAGQRCSALRVLCLQEEVADRVLAMLEGALRELRVGRPDRLSTDVGPVIDAGAQRGIESHIDAMRSSGRRVRQYARDRAGEWRFGSFVAPTVIEIDSIAELEHEVFGPVLHVLRWRRGELGALIEQIDATGYGLTLGIHTRIDETVDFIAERARAGNVYVNRTMIGAVVGVQPFGGERLSGTGPKAGGPLYLRRLLGSCPPGRFAAQAAEARKRGRRVDRLAPLGSLGNWLARRGDAELAACCEQLAEGTPVGLDLDLAGPTGERNRYRLLPREAVLCLAADDGDLLFQLAHALAAGSRAVWPDSAARRQLAGELPADVRGRIRLDAEPLEAEFDAALIQAEAEEVARWSRRLAERPGAIVGLDAAPKGARDAGSFSLDRLVVERTMSINTAAAGGNASLMAVG